jgi:naphthoate synthase
VLLTGNGPSRSDGGWAFCSGGDQRIRGKDGYQYAEGDGGSTDIDPRPRGPAAHPRGAAPDPLHAEGGHLRGARLGGRGRAQPARRADLTLASREHARFKQTDADVASFDGGFGSAYLARQVGQKFAREIFFLGREYTADDAVRMGMVNAVGRPRRPRAQPRCSGRARSTARAPPRSAC